MVCKVVTDVDALDLNRFYELVSQSDLDVCFEGDEIYVYSKYNTQRSISMIMKKIGITNFFCKKIEEKSNDKQDFNFVSSWIRKKMEKDELEKFETQKQSELQKMMDNISQAKEMLHQILLKQEVGDGGNSGDGAEEERPS